MVLHPDLALGCPVTTLRQAQNPNAQHPNASHPRQADVCGLVSGSSHSILFLADPAAALTETASSWDQVLQLAGMHFPLLGVFR